MPEVRIILSHATVYLAISSKSNSVYEAINNALSDIKNGELNADIKKGIIPIGNHEYNVILTTKIEKDDMNIELVAEAQFLYESEDHSREESIINTNTVAIMFPFIRSQVTLLTSQPGMAPIILPPINTQKLK